MMRRVLVDCLVVTLGVSLLVVSGCANTPPTRFYVLPTLTNADTAPGTSAVKRDITIGVGPVTLPPYLDRPQIVTRASRARLDLAEFDQWAAPLHDDVSRVLAENLSRLIPTDYVVLAPWPRTTLIDYQVTVEVTRFDGGVGNEVVLAARWTIVNADGKELLMRKSRFQAAAAAQDYEAMVTAMSRTLDALSREISATILTLAQQAPPAR
jgi:uncharacterized lipoprotein YmbA